MQHILAFGTSRADVSTVVQLSQTLFLLNARCSELHLALIISVENRGHIQPKGSNSEQGLSKCTQGHIGKMDVYVIGPLDRNDLHTALMVKVIFILHNWCMCMKPPKTTLVTIKTYLYCQFYTVI